ncbi:hypothetical protein GCM10011515_04710 [Tsuneonella deserti]|uniref:DUF3592 domain-containing protein n=1 Tax=Tsuneonella deserti TaxID=2035528 RepID=A0ABQ1RZD4_9SPHN|nr:DUF3592 domain-containing protein [Tsuneonella deserti]GGD88139.1 hypothetical protein GCM10011515_04710 [Tsuneonella deserti]
MDPIALGLIAAAAAIVALGWWLYRRKVVAAELAAGTWSSVPGTIHEASVREDVTWDAQNERVSELIPVVRYAYSANGREYEGDRAFLSRAKFDSDAAAKAWQGTCKPGPATVWFDPADPAKSVLQIDRPSKGGLFVAGVFAVILVGVALAL